MLNEQHSLYFKQHFKFSHCPFLEEDDGSLTPSHTTVTLIEEWTGI